MKHIVKEHCQKKVKETMNTTLLIMAAGIGSRFGTGIEQLEPVDASNHIIMDYSIHDAIEAGFNHVVFIIRIKTQWCQALLNFRQSIVSTVRK